MSSVNAHGYSGNFTEKEFLERAKDHERASKIGLALGPNTNYVRTFDACALALKLAAPLLEQYYKDLNNECNERAESDN